MATQPKWLQDFNNFLKQLNIDYDKRQKIIKAVLNILKSFKKKWEEKFKSKPKPLL